MLSKTKLFAVKFRRILKVFTWWGLWRKFWAHFHDLCVQKWSCCLRSSDAFRRFSPCEVYKKISGRIITIFASTNEAVLPWSSDGFWKFSPCKLFEKVMGACSRLLRPKMKLFAVDSDAFLKLWLCKVYEESFGRIIWIYASKIKAVWCWSQMQCGSFLPARFTEKVLGTFLRFMCPKMKLFPAMFRRISEVFTLRCIAYNESSGRIITTFASTNEAVCQEVQTDFGNFLRANSIKKFTAHYHDFCVQKWSCLLLSSDAFWTFSPYEVYEESSWHIIAIFASKNKAVCREVQTHFGSSH